MHFLPPYSPNLNPIERLWKFVNERVLYNKYYKNFDDFRNAVLGFLENLFVPSRGAGEYSRQEKSRFYRMAKRSATECAAIFDVCERLRLIDRAQYEKGREMLVHIVNMLTKMAKTNE